MSEAPDHSHDDDVLAAEYAMHLLSPQDRRTFEARLKDDPGLRALVAAWQERLAPLADEVPPIAPPPAVKAALMDRLFKEEPAPAPGWWGRLALWRALALASMAAAVVLAALLFVQQSAPGQPVMVAEVAAADDSLRVLARYNAKDGVLQVSRVTGKAAAGRALELWLIVGQETPVSLGVLPAGKRGQLTVASNLRPLMSDAILAISDEPPGGSPTGAPTGAVLAVGQINSV